MRRITSLLVCLLLFGFYAAFGQDIQLKGTVTAADDGSTLPGVYVKIKGTNTGTNTDASGKYQLTVPAGSTLVFTSIGYKDQEIAVSPGQTKLDVAMETEVQAVDEVVVTALGVSRQKKALGYSVQEVKSDAISNDGNTHMLDALAGKVAGVNILRTSGTAGSASFVEIRGAGSITGSNRPLFVIDGIPVNGGGGYKGSNVVDGVDIGDRVGDLNSEDIESISVLKSGAASALYGLRAANGVVLITTKKGKAGKMVVNVHSAVTFEKPGQLPEMQDQYVQGTYGNILFADSPSSSRRLSWGANVKDLSYTTDAGYLPSASSKPMSEWMRDWDPNGRIVFADNPLANGRKVNMYDAYDFFQTGLAYKNNVSVSGGNETATYYASAGNTNEEGIVPNNTFNKTNLKLAATLNASKIFKFSTDISYLENTANRIQTGSNISGLMLGLVRTPPSFDNSYGYQFSNGTQRNFRGGGSSTYDNPYWIVNKINYKDRFDRVIANFKADANVFPWLTVSYKVGTDFYFSQTTQYFAPNSNAAPSGYYQKDDAFSQDIQSGFYANIDKTFEDFGVKLMLGQEIYQSKSSSVTGYVASLLMPGWENIGNTGTNKSTEANYKKRTSSVFGDLNLSYKSMIFVGFTGRVDKSTTLPKGKNSFFYPSASLGFVFTELPALKSLSFLTFGKIRASYAKTGRDAAAYSTTNSYTVPTAADGWVTYGIQFPYAGYAGFAWSNTLGNSDLKPEMLIANELGIDLNFFKNRLGLEFSYFKNKNQDLLLAVPVASSSGWTASYRNAATMETKGIELMLNTTPVKSKSVEWNLSFGFSNPHSKVTSLYGNIPEVNLGGFTDPQIHAILDRSYRTIWGSVFMKDAKGRIVIDPSTGYPSLATNYGPCADFEEDFKFTVNNNLRYKNLYLNFLLEWKKGGKMYNGTIAAMNYFGTSKETASRETAHKVFAGVYGVENADGSVSYTDAAGNASATPVTNTTDVLLDQDYYTYGPGSNFGTGPTENFIEDTDWLRLRELTVGYTLPRKLTQKFFVQQLDVYFTGNNLFLSTPYKGVDPETSLMGTGNAQGIDYFNMPGIKSYTFGIKLTL